MKKIEEHDFLRIFGQVSTLPNLIAQLWQLFQDQNPTLSLTHLCQSAGLRSKGHVSDMIHGRRQLSAHRAEAFGRALGLSGTSLRIFTTYAELNQTQTDKSKKRLTEKLEKLTKSVKIDQRLTPIAFEPHDLSFEVFCAIGLFKSSCRYTDLVNFFGKEQTARIDQSIEQLHNLGVISKEGQNIRLLTSQIAFRGGSTGHQNFIRMSLADAREKLPRLFEKREEAHFETVLLSVKKSEYKKFLDHIRDDVAYWRSTLETEQADEIVRINLQVYPISRRGITPTR